MSRGNQVKARARVLLLEDHGSVAVPMCEVLGLSYEVRTAFSITDADELLTFWLPDVLIVDLNFSPEGLDPELLEESRSGMLTGWLWLKYRVFPKRPDLRKRTIIYSEYIDELVESIATDELAGVAVIPKRGRPSSAERIMSTIREMLDAD